MPKDEHLPQHGSSSTPRGEAGLSGGGELSTGELSQEAGPEDVWEQPEMVSRFANAGASDALIELAQSAGRPLDILDIGCGAGRNSIPLAREGHRVVGVDSALAMIEAAEARAYREEASSHARLRQGDMSRLPVTDGAFDLIVAHGVWNLAASDDQFRRAVAEAARAARSGAWLYVFTFSRNTLHPDARPLEGSSYIYTEFGGYPQCFLREEELIAELRAVGFERPETGPLRELNRPAPWEKPRGGAIPIAGPKVPVIYEGIWVRT